MNIRSLFFEVFWYFILFCVVVVFSANTAMASQSDPATIPPDQKWSFSGIFGNFDKAQLQRGFKIYKNVCSTCHSLTRVHFRTLAQEGGLGFTPEQISVLAKEYTIIDEEVEGGERAGKVSDHFPAPYVTELDARAANGGSLPPDLSVITKARSKSRGNIGNFIDMVTLYQEGGSDYVYALLNGYQQPPKGWKVPDGKYFNKYFPGHNISMPKPLSDEIVEYTDGTPMTVQQYSKDVVAFLSWAAEPKMVERKKIGLRVFLLFGIFAFIVYLKKRKVWKELGH